MAELAHLTAQSHSRCYSTTECLCLAGKRKSGMSLAEIRLARCDDGWRSSHGFGFTGGDCWGSWSPIFASSPVQQTRADAIRAEAARLVGHIADREGPEATKIRNWCDSLVPDQADMFA